jgi:beta-phosphoglucomutase family hydrolase/Cof subfamily protein (haloacid dehalogenase superfamily)
MRLGAMPIRLVISDIDGTLLTSGKGITDRTRVAVMKLREAGVLFAVTSSRPPRAMVKLIEDLGITTPVAAFNGAILVRPDLAVIEERIIPLVTAREIAEHLLAAGVDVWVFRGLDWYVGDASGHRVEREARNLGFEPIVTDVRTVLDGAVKIVGVSPDSALLHRCELELRERLGMYVSVARSHRDYLDVTDTDANKGTVAKMCSLFLRIPLDEIAAIGDMTNDVFMFGVVGSSIAMGNASPELRRAARYVTTSNDEDGFAKAVDWFILRKEEPPRQHAFGLPARTRACLFDLDGVLTQTAKLHAKAWKTTFDDYLRERAARTGEPFVPFDPVADYGKYVDGKIRTDGARSFLASRGLRPSEEEVAEVARRKDDLLVDLLHHERVATFDSSVSYVREVRKAGLRTAVVSASKHCAEVLESCDIADLFDVRVDGVVAANAHLAGKPAPDTFLAAAEALGVDPAEAVVFEDALAGVEAGRAGHFGYVIGVDRLGQEAELREHGADAVVTDLSALLEPP